MSLKERLRKLEENGGEHPPIVVTFDAAGMYHHDGVAYPDREAFLKTIPPGRFIVTLPDLSMMDMDPDQPTDTGLEWTFTQTT